MDLVLLQSSFKQLESDLSPNKESKELGQILPSKTRPHFKSIQPTIRHTANRNVLIYD